MEHVVGVVLLLDLAQPGNVGVHAAGAAGANGEVGGTQAAPHLDGLAPVDRAAATGEASTMSTSYVKVLLMELVVLAVLWWLERAFI